VEFADVVRNRRMVRNYDPDRPVPKEALDRLFDYAIRAPSAGFSQGWGFLVLTEEADRDQFWRLTAGDGAPDSWLRGLQRAPVLVVACSSKDVYLDRYAERDKGWTDRNEAHWPVPYWHIDTGFASLLMMLGAVDDGLATCFFGIPPDKIATFRQAFDVPNTYDPIGVLSIGYPAPDRKSPSLKRGRRGVDQVVHRGRWSTTTDE
jgi:nitroreductase